MAEDDFEGRRAPRRHTSPLDPGLQEVVRIAAIEAVRSTFLNFGVDIQDPDSVRDFMADLIYIRQVRMRSARAAGAMITGAIGIVLGGLSALILDYLRHPL